MTFAAPGTVSHGGRLAVTFLIPVGMVGCVLGRAGNPNGSFAGMGIKECAGAAIGTVVDSLAGPFRASGNGGLVVALAGATIGGFAGNLIRAHFDDEDKKALQAQARQAPLTQPDNASLPWRSGHPGATATILTPNTHVET